MHGLTPGLEQTPGTGLDPLVTAGPGESVGNILPSPTGTEFARIGTDKTFQNIPFNYI